ncbi:PAS domain S-box protein [Variovorax sp. J22R133]|uniref:hybrid sensor histidine kinase/response regulator n=1 Tax=Variovorax brevis TaxID=3053503 RepID=UPI002576A507|nr:PAS domain-containing sensor histidine kinase [Variovorax sp. J22R133]MDM0115400.1 PAS domain S-box protein [Variovorax sp. J22R133]
MSNDDPVACWPACGGEIAGLIRNFGPDSTPLGPPDRWPRALRNAVDLILRSAAQMSVFWGPDYLCLYNDAYAQTMGEKHPATLGRQAARLSPEVWSDLLPMFERVRVQGETISARDSAFTLFRDGALQELYFDFSWSPLLDDDGSIGGMFCTVTETSERVHAMRALAASERKERDSREQLQMAQAAGGIGVFTLDVESDAMSVSGEFCRIFGVPVREVYPYAELEQLRTTRNDRMSTRDSRVNGTAPLEVEYQIRRADDGAVRWIARRAEMVRNESGKTVLIRGVVQDITADKHAEATLRQSEARFRALAREMPGQVWTADVDGLMDWASESLCAYTGLDMAELMGEGWTRIMHPEEMARVGQLWAHALATGNAYVNEVRLRRHDGAWRWHLARAQPLQGGDDTGSALRWVGINTDIDDQKTAHDRLAQSVVERTRDRDRLWQLSSDVMLMVDMSGRIVAVNPAWQALLGWSEAQLLGSRFVSLLHPDDVGPTVAEFRRLRGGQLQSGIENRVRHQDGGYRTLSWTAVPDERLMHAVGRDVTALRESEARLRQSQRMEAIGQLTGGIAHDFNNLLLGITGPIELIRRGIAQGRYDGLDRYMGVAWQSAQRATSLIQRLLAFSRQQTLDPRPTDVNELIGSMGELLHRTLGEHVRLALSLDAGVGAAFGDGAQLESAILNLAINARDAMPHGGELRIRTSAMYFDEALASQHELAPGHYCAISVTDTGSGMSPEVLAKVFEPFFTTKPTGRGTGLGLSMVYGFAQQSHGQVLIQSELGAGTTVTLHVPRARVDDSPAMARTSSAPALPLGKGEVVLVVEDDPSVRLLVLDVLDSLRYRTMHVHDGTSAIPILESTARIDLLVSDVGLPGINGRKVAEIARRSRPALPVVFMTGYAEHVRTRAEFLGPGMRMIAKPFAIDDFAQLVQQAMGSHP